MSKTGRNISEPIRKFIREQKRIAPGLTQSAIAAMVESKYGADAKVDQSSVGRILREGDVGAGGAVIRSLTISEVWPHGFLNREEILRGDAAMRWATDRPQQAGDEFLLDLGEEHDVRGIRFLQGILHQWDHPKRWHMTFSDSDRIINEIGGTGYIEAKFEETVSVRMIGVEILEPRLPTDHPPSACWAVDNILIGPADWEFGLMHTVNRKK